LDESAEVVECPDLDQLLLGERGAEDVLKNKCHFDHTKGVQPEVFDQEGRTGEGAHGLGWAFGE
jgi:hypothetical protein